MVKRNLTLDADGATLDLVVNDTPNGTFVAELKISCPPGHPTGVTTAILRAITASDLTRTPSSSRQDQLRAYLASLPPAKWQPGSRNNLAKDQLRILAEIYVRALSADAAPTKTIQEWLGCSRPTASRAVKMAQDLGLLDPPARKGLPAKSRSKTHHQGM